MAPTHVTTVDSAFELLRKLSLFQGLPERALQNLAEKVTFKQYEADKTIFYQDDLVDRIWLLYSGQVKIVYHELDGKEVILEMIYPGEVFGGGVLLFPKHPATAKAMEHSTIASFSSSLYDQFLLDNPVFALKLLKMIGARHHSMLNMQVLVGERVERRMAHILLKLATRVGRQNPDGILITVPLSRQDLADMACTTLETAIRVISRFNSQHLVSTKRGGYLVVHDLEGLESLTR